MSKEIKLKCKELTERCKNKPRIDLSEYNIKSSQAVNEVYYLPINISTLIGNSITSTSMIGITLATIFLKSYEILENSPIKVFFRDERLERYRDIYIQHLNDGLYCYLYQDVYNIFNIYIEHILAFSEAGVSDDVLKPEIQKFLDYKNNFFI